MTQKTWAILCLVMGVWLLTACAAPTPTAAPPDDPSIYFTQAAATVIAQFTGTAVVASPTPPAATPTPQTTEPPTPVETTPTISEITATSQPAPTLVPTFTPVVFPTFTPRPTISPPPPLPTIPPCDLAELYGESYVNDTTGYAPGVEFTKTWRVTNRGACTWTQNYRLLLVDGFIFDGPVSIPIGRLVRPGESVDITGTFIAPDQGGRYVSSWMMRNDLGELFGFGSGGYSPLRLDVDVSSVPFTYAYDFTYYYCSARWQSGVGNIPCPGQVGEERGFILLLDQPRLENGLREDEPTLWTRPNLAQAGFITGSFPAIRIREGYRLRSWIGCLYDSPRCSVSFQVDYAIENGPVRNLGVWQQTYDNDVGSIDVDLSGLAGNTVRFVFTVLVQNNRPDQADAFWLAPRIESPYFDIR